MKLPFNMVKCKYQVSTGARGSTRRSVYQTQRSGEYVQGGPPGRANIHPAGVISPAVFSELPIVLGSLFVFS